MSNSKFAIKGLSLSPILAIRHFLFAAFLLFSAQLSVLHAQATLSIQGILKKTNGVAVDDGTYNMTFKLYTAQTGGTALWTETQNDVEVSSGIYSTVLGNTTPLTAAFNQIYFLGVTIGSAELTPRIQLTSAPYALALIGSTNQFPSSGKVKADSIVVNGGVLAKGGAPGLNGVNRNGYAFSGNSGDKDSGLFSTADGEVSLYTNNVEVLSATPGNVAVTGDLAATGKMSASNMELSSGGTVKYNGVSDWRLVQTNYLETGPDGWQVSPPMSGDEGAWRNSSLFNATTQDFGDFAGKSLATTDNDNVYKKQFNLSAAGPYTYIKVVFNYYIIDNWDYNDGASVGWSAFSNNATGSTLRVGWTKSGAQFMNGTHYMQNNVLRDATNFAGENTYSDMWTPGEMVGRYPSTNGSFWVFFGYSNDENDNDENFGVGSIEIWVK